MLLNDNGMSITPNVGAISRYLAQARLRPRYLDFKLRYRTLTAKSGFGQKLYALTHKIKERMRRSLLGTTLFENLGFTYLGPVDGHDVSKIETLLRTAAALREPVLIHLITRKGKGYEPAEKTPQDFHGIGRFDPDTGMPAVSAAPTFSDIFGQELCRMAASDQTVCAITAAMQHGTGLDPFASDFPARFFDVGIAEGHAVCMAAGLAKQGMKPVAALYSTFLQRAYDMLLHDVALQQLHVVLAVDRCGIVGEDGETHQGMFDVGYLRQVPGLKIFSPASFAELREDLHAALYACTGPAAIRYPRGGEGSYTAAAAGTLLREGYSCTVICYGTMINAVLAAADTLQAAGYRPEILKLRTISPVDWASIEASARKTRRVFVLEETSDRECLADEIFAHLIEAGIPAVCRKRNLGRRFVPHGAPAALLAAAGLDADSITTMMQEELSR